MTILDGLTAATGLRRVAAGQSVLGLTIAALALIWPSAPFALSIGALALIVGLALPVRILARGLRLPKEIKSAIRVQGAFLVSAGLILLICALIGPLARQLAFVAVALSAMIAAYRGPYTLSTQQPETFSAREMLAIFKSAGVNQSAEDSPVNRAYGRWAPTAEGVPVGQHAPDGPAITLDGQEAALSTYLEGGVPVVLNFGSYSCPHHRRRLPELKRVMAEWQPKGVRFVTVYIAEAHPEDEWRLEGQYREDPEFTCDADFCFYQAKGVDERRAMAERLIETRELSMDVVLDTMENALLRAYNAWPIRLYVIQGGVVRYSGDQGPFGYDPEQVHQALLRSSSEVER
ncbi:MAG: deiodinase-like protein [Bradymonadia bacterium]